MNLTFAGKRWKLEFTALPISYDNPLGMTQDPTTKGRRIFIKAGQAPKRELDTLVHEAIHALGWWLDEEYVAKWATDITNMLWKLGFRRLNKQQLKQWEADYEEFKQPKKSDVESS